MDSVVWTIIVGLGLSLVTVLPASASVFCVQAELRKAGYDVGIVDGALGPKTKTAAQSFAEENSLTLSELSPTDAWKWCSAMRQARLDLVPDALPTINGLSALDFDVSSPPPGAPSMAQRKAFWNMHKVSSVCMPQTNAYGHGMTYELPKLSAEDFASPPDLVFPAASKRLDACRLPAYPQPAARGDDPMVDDDPPAPLLIMSGREITNMNEHYGSKLAAIDLAAFWFVRRLLADRYIPGRGDAELAIDRMVEWAEAGSMTRNIQGEGNGNSGTVFWQYATAAADIMSVYVEVAPRMTAEQRGIVGPWLNTVLAKIVGNSERYRTHNHHVGWGLNLAVWGLAIGDHGAVQNAIDRYKMAIYDMRPDGSFPAETSRGGEGLTYQSLITSDLVVMALFFRHSLGIDLFSYSVDGHTVHDAVDFVLASIADPSINKKYAHPCARAGDFYGATVDEPHVPTMGPGLTFHDLSYLPSYARLFPDRASHKTIVQNWTMPSQRAAVHSVLGAAPACMFDTTLENFIRSEVDSLPTAPSELSLQD